MRRIALASLACLLLSWRPCAADAISVNVLQARYTTTVYADIAGAPVVDRMLQGSLPTQDAVSIPPTLANRGLSASADADLFASSVATSSGYVDDALSNTHARASAETILSFRPVQDGVDTLDLLFTAGDNNPFFSSGTVSLVNLTANQTLWSVGWTKPNFFDLPWVDVFDPTHPYDPWFTASLALNSAFSASNEYELRMFVTSDANFDGQRVGVQVSGLHATPEPSTLALLAIGVGATYVQRRRRGDVR